MTIIAKHTPGPWITAVENVNRREDVPENPKYLITDAQARAVAVASPLQGRADHPERDANARLIAASPTLLKAASAALQRMAEVYRNTFDSRMDNDPLVIELRAAIAQATAGQTGGRP
jgi:hypothetical protein